jgi:hypothetical protein
MATKTDMWQGGYNQGFNAGYHAAQADMKTNIPGVQQQFYDLNPHDLDTLALGIALLVLHASDIETINATMETQRKMGIAEIVLSWLHSICSHPEEYEVRFSLNETDPRAPETDPRAPDLMQESPQLFGTGLVGGPALVASEETTDDLQS